MITFTADSMAVGERVPGGYVFVDGSGVGDIGPEVMRDREILGDNGFMIVNLTITRETHELVGEPEFVSRGFIFQRESEEMLAEARQVIEEVIQAANGSSANVIRKEIQRKMDRYFYRETKRRPMVFAFVTEV
jgi:ribonuclease J